MEPKIEIVSAKKLIGKRLPMSLINNKTGELWKNFMQQRAEIKDTIGSTLYSLQVYNTDYFTSFNPNNVFEKWALTEVSNFDFIPREMETFTLPEGMYAVFFYKGLNTNMEIFQYIFGTWLPNSKYSLDDRPHFEALGEKYKNNDPNSEEEIWIPIKMKEI